MVARQVPSHIVIVHVHARCSRQCKKRAGSNPVWYMPAGVGTGGDEPMQKTIVLGPKHQNSVCDNAQGKLLPASGDGRRHGKGDDMNSTWQRNTKTWPKLTKPNGAQRDLSCLV